MSHATNPLEGFEPTNVLKIADMHDVERVHFEHSIAIPRRDGVLITISRTTDVEVATAEANEAARRLGLTVVHTIERDHYHKMESYKGRYGMRYSNADHTYQYGREVPPHIRKSIDCRAMRGEPDVYKGVELYELDPMPSEFWDLEFHCLR